MSLKLIPHIYRQELYAGKPLAIKKDPENSDAVEKIGMAA